MIQVKKWTVLDIDKLKREWVQKSVLDIAIMLDRTVPSIQNKARVLQLPHKLNRNSPEIVTDKTYKVFLKDKASVKYIVAESSKQAVEIFCKGKFLFTHCKEKNAKIVCQGNDARRTRKYYKFI